MTTTKLRPKIFIANDHAGFALKEFLIKQNPEEKWEDLGVFSTDTSSYPQEASTLCRHLLKEGPDSFGVLICGSGQGMAMQANRFPGIRAGVCWNEESARLSREHNKANVLCLGARLVPPATAQNILTVFIQTDFKGGRHLIRVEQLDKPLGNKSL